MLFSLWAFLKDLGTSVKSFCCGLKFFSELTLVMSNKHDIKMNKRHELEFIFHAFSKQKMASYKHSMSNFDYCKEQNPFNSQT